MNEGPYRGCLLACIIDKILNHIGVFLLRKAKMMRRGRTGLWSNSDFVKLWLGQTVSHFGSGITGIALPLTAVLVLAATPTQMGILGALDGASVLVISLLAGVWVDRVRRRPLLLAADLGRAFVLGTIPF